MSSSFAGVARRDLDRIGVVVVALLDGVDQLGHAVADDRAVLELVAARADRHVEAAQVALVVDRDPVVRAVVEVDDALHLLRDRQRRDAAGAAIDLRLPLLARDLAVEVVGVLDPHLRIAIGILGADQDVVPGLGPEVDGVVAVGDVVAVLLVVEARRRRDVVHLVAQRLRLDLHAVLDACHAVDHERVRAGDVDDDLGVDLAAVVERRRRARGRPAWRISVTLRR